MNELAEGGKKTGGLGDARRRWLKKTLI